MTAGLLVAFGSIYEMKEETKSPKPEAALASRFGQSAQPQKVLVSEIGHRVQIIGDFGKPIGEMMTIRGVWSDPPEGMYKDDPTVFVVNFVDGIPLKTPVKLKNLFLSYFGTGRVAEQLDPPLKASQQRDLGIARI